MVENKTFVLSPLNVFLILEPNNRNVSWETGVMYLWSYINRSELVEKTTMLRTKAMREKEEQRERRKYNYTLLRIRLPDGNLLQG